MALNENNRRKEKIKDMWIFLDDFADSVHLKPYKIGRLAACGALLVIAAVTGVIGALGGQSGKKQYEANQETLSQAQYNLNLEKERLAELEAGPDVEYYEPAQVCDRIAALQTSYGGFSSSTTKQDFMDRNEQVRDELDGYVIAGSSKTAWFEAPTEKYTWSAVNTADSTVSQVPIIWECRGSDGTLYAVAEGVYDGESGRAGQFKPYTTAQGKYLISGSEDPDTSQAGQQVAEVQEGAQQNAGTESGTGTAQNGQSGQQTQTVKIDGLPEGYTEADRASIEDNSFNGRSPVLTQEEADFRKTLTSAEKTEFENLSHAARSRYMADKKGQTTVQDPSAVVPDAGSQGTQQQPPQAPVQQPGTDTKKLTNDEILKNILNR